MTEGANVKYTADPSQLLAANEKVLASQQKIIDRLSSMRGSSRAAADQAGKTNTILAAAGRFAAGYVSVAKAIGMVTRAFGEMQQATKGGLSRLEQDLPNIASLTQIAGRKTTEEFLEQRDAMRLLGIDRDRATKIITEMENAGITDKASQRAVVQMARFTPYQPEELITGSGIIRGQFGGAAGSTEAIMNKIGVAAKESRLTIENMAKAASGAGGMFKTLNLTDEELLAAVAVWSKTAPSAEEAGTGLEAVLRVAMQKQKGGKTFLETIKNLQQDKGTARELETGRASGKMWPFLQMPQNLAAYQDQLKKIQDAERLTGTGDSFIGQMKRQFRDSPRAMAALNMSIATQRQQIMEERKGLQAQPVVAAVQKRITETAFSDSIMQQAGRRMGSWFLRSFEELAPGNDPRKAMLVQNLISNWVDKSGGTYPWTGLPLIGEQRRALQEYRASIPRNSTLAE